jgi:hypothetical protein
MECATFEELEIEINKQIEQALQSTAETLADDFVDTIQRDIYDRYSPRFYNRTYETLATPKCQAKGNEAVIYLDENEIHTIDNHTHTLFKDGITVDDFLHALDGNYNHLDAVDDFKDYVDKNLTNIFSEKWKG